MLDLIPFTVAQLFTYMPVSSLGYFKLIMVGVVWIFLNVLITFTYLPARRGVYIEQKWLELVLTLMQAYYNFQRFNFLMCLTLC
jgi:hypothetical protein